MSEACVEEDEVCPNCGDWAVLRYDTGWCATCSGGEVCPRCGSWFKHDTNNRKYCSTCRKHDWIERNADAIESQMENGLSFVEAKKQVAEDNKPTCQSCGIKVPRGFFCIERKECRQAYHRYKWKRRKGLSIEVALREAIHTNEIN